MIFSVYLIEDIKRDKKMKNESLVYWINNEIPRYLSKFNTFSDFEEAMPAACASGEWKKYAFAMASVKWNHEITTICR